MKPIEPAIPGGAEQAATEFCNNHQPHVQLAIEQAAMFAAQVAIARWSEGDLPPPALAPSSQARWYDQMHGHFTAWLRAGGFAQAEDEPLLSENALHDGMQGEMQCEIRGDWPHLCRNGWSCPV